MPTPQEIHDYVDEQLVDHPEIPPYVAHNMVDVESAGNAGAVSPKGARGPMQLMPDTARQLGVDPDNWKQNIDGGLRYLGDNIKQFGDVGLGVAAYHAGPGAVRKAGGIPNTNDGIMNTGDYVNRIVGGPKTMTDTGDPVPTPPPRGAPALPPLPGSRIVTLGEPASEAEQEGAFSAGLKDMQTGLYGMAAGVNKGLQLAGRAIGSDAIASQGTSGIDYWQQKTADALNSMTPEHRAALTDPILNDDLSIPDGVVSKLYHQTLQQIPALLSLGAAGKVAQVGLKGLDAAGAVSRLVRLGVPADIAPKVLINGGAAIAAGIPQGLLFGLQSGAEAESGIHQTPVDQLANSPAFQRFYAQTDSALPDQRRAELARDQLAQLMGDDATKNTAAVFGGVGALTGGGVFGKFLRPGFTGGLAARGAKGAALEAGSLAGQMGAANTLTNQDIQENIDPNRSLTAGLPNALASGATMGAAFGAGGGILHPRVGEAPHAAPDILADQAARARTALGEDEEAFPAEVVPETTPETTPETPAPPVAPSSDIGRKSDNAPFPSMAQANMALRSKKLADTHDVVPVDGGFVLRPKEAGSDGSVAPEAPSEGGVAPEDVHSEAVSTESEQAPEVNKPEALAESPPKPGVDSETGEVVQPPVPGMEPGDIGRNKDGKPFANRKAAVDALAAKAAGKDLFVSKIGDNAYVLRKQQKAAPFSSEQPVSTQVPQEPEQAMPKPAPKADIGQRLVSKIKALGGVDIREASDAVGETGMKARRLYPGLFRNSAKNDAGQPTAGHALSSLVHDGKLDDYLPPNMRKGAEGYDETDSVEYLRDLINRDLTSKDVGPHEQRVEREYNALHEEEKPIHDEAVADAMAIGRRMTDEETDAWLEGKTGEAPAGETGRGEESHPRDAKEEATPLERQPGDDDDTLALTDEQRAEAAQKADDEGPLFSRKSGKYTDEQQKSVLDGFRALAKHDDAFQFGTSKSKSMQTIANEIAPKNRQPIRIENDPEAAFGRPDVVQGWVLTDPANPERVTLKRYVDDKLELNVADLKPGSGGSEFYAIAEQFAHNNGLKFTGDREGISPIAMLRRTEHLTSAALRHGTTEHIAPHEDQTIESKASDSRASPIDWREGEHDHNTTDLILTSMENVERAIPGVKNFEYDFKRGYFKSRVTGQRVDPADFRGFSFYGGEESDGPRKGPYGGTAVARAIFARTLLRAIERPDASLGALHELESKPLPDDLKKILYSIADRAPERGLSVSDIEKALPEKLSGGPEHVVVQSVKDLPSKDAPADAEGMYQNGNAYFVADNLTPERAAEVANHEIFHHAVATMSEVGAGLQRMFNQNQNVRAAAAKWMRENPKNDLTPKQYRQTASNEAIARFAESGTEIKGLDKFIASIQTGLRRLGLGKVADWMEGKTNAELMRFVSDAFKSMASPNEPTYFGASSEAPASRPEPVWRSQLAETIAAKAPFGKDGSIQASQLRQWAESRIKDGAFKKDEYEWSGLGDYLKLQDGKVTRDQVQQFLDQHGVKVEEKVLGNSSGYDYQGLEWQHAIDRAEADGDHAEAERINRAWEGIDEETGSTAGSTKYSEHQLPGGKNYRELLLTLPHEQDRSAERLKQIEALNARMAANGTTDAEFAKLSSERDAIKSGMRDQSTRIFKAPHFDEHGTNLLAHVRFNERTDANGKKVLFIEELQSDFGQGYRRAKDSIAKAVDSDFNGIVKKMIDAGVLTKECD
jgi:Transglycosylase SLT domain